MEKGIIRTIDTPKDVFFEFPIRTLQAFTLMSQTGFLIEKNTLKSIHSTMRYLRNMPSELVGKELRKIMTGRYVMQTLKLMHKEGIFNAPIILGNKSDNYHSGIEKTKVLLNNYIESAENKIKILPNNVYKSALEEFLELLSNV